MIAFIVLLLVNSFCFFTFRCILLSRSWFNFYIFIYKISYSLFSFSFSVCFITVF